MTVGELKELLEEFDDDLEVRMAIQPNYPLQSSIGGVVSDVVTEKEEEKQIIYVLEGNQIRDNPYAPRGLWG